MIVACVACRATHGFLRLFGKGATALPGRIALIICPELLKRLAKHVKVIAVTGTNGKTTSVRMTEAAVKAAGFSVFSNRSGANMPEGIVTAFVMNADILGRPRCEWAVIECDEGHAARLFGELMPVTVLVTNLFRDQSDRYGDVLTPARTIRRGLRELPDAVLALNADCQLLSLIYEGLPNKKVFFGMDGISGKKPDETEYDRCTVCGGKLIYSSVSYSNCGDWHCVKCGRRRREPEVCVLAVSEGELLLSVYGSRHICRLSAQGLYNACNAAGMTAAVTASGIELKNALAAASDFEQGFGRMEELPLGKVGAKMILVKNAAAINQTLDYIKSVPGGKVIVFAQNARAGDGRDLSWLNDADFEKLLRIRELRRVIVTGDCAKETDARLKKAGVRCEIFRDYTGLISILEDEEYRIFLLPSYTAMLELRKTLVRRLGGKDFWE